MMTMLRFLSVFFFCWSAGTAFADDIHDQWPKGLPSAEEQREFFQDLLGKFTIEINDNTHSRTERCEGYLQNILDLNVRFIEPIFVSQNVDEVLEKIGAQQCKENDRLDHLYHLGWYGSIFHGEEQKEKFREMETPPPPTFTARHNFAVFPVEAGSKVLKPDDVLYMAEGMCQNQNPEICAPQHYLRFNPQTCEKIKSYNVEGRYEQFEKVFFNVTSGLVEIDRKLLIYDYSPDIELPFSGGARTGRTLYLRGLDFEQFEELQNGNTAILTADCTYNLKEKN